MTRSHLTLLVEDLAALAAAANDARCPALERCLARGRAFSVDAADADALRLSLFHLDSGTPAPVAALTALTDGLAEPGDARCWLRVEPVTLSADMTRVFMTAHGLEDVDDDDRAELRDCVRTVLADAGFALESARPDRWLLALPEAPGCALMRLDEALGRDLADTLPAAGAGREWRRLMTELQVALHNAEVNRRRRAAGRREINGAWLWGAGRLPGAAPACGFDRVYADHPVSAGLARLAGAVVESAQDEDLVRAANAGERLLFDWPTGRGGALLELARIEAAIAALSPSLRSGRAKLVLLDGGGAGWRVDRGALGRFWRRPRALAASLRRDDAE